jgi:hypothetical protein
MDYAGVEERMERVRQERAKVGRGKGERPARAETGERGVSRVLLLLLLLHEHARGCERRT